MCLLFMFFCMVDGQNRVFSIFFNDETCEMYRIRSHCKVLQQRKGVGSDMDSIRKERKKTENVKSQNIYTITGDGRKKRNPSIETKKGPLDSSPPHSLTSTL